MKIYGILVVVAVVVFLFSGCREDEISELYGYKYKIESVPAGAMIYFNGTPMGKTSDDWDKNIDPSTLSSIKIEAELPGYEIGYFITDFKEVQTKNVEIIRGEKLFSLVFSLPRDKKNQSIENKILIEPNQKFKKGEKIPIDIMLKVSLNLIMPESLGEQAEKVPELEAIEPKKEEPETQKNIHCIKAEKYFNQKKWAKVIVEAEKISEEDLCYHDAMKWIAHSKSELSKPAHSKSELSKQKKEKPEPPRNIHCIQAEQSFNQKKWAEVIVEAGKISEDDACYYDAMQWILYSEEEMKKEDFEKAKEYCSSQAFSEGMSILMKYENDKESHEYIHQCYFQQGEKLFKEEEYLKAIEEFKNAKIFNDTCPECNEYIKNSKNKYCEICYNKAWEFYENEDLEKALSEYKSVEQTCGKEYKDIQKMIEAITETIKKR